MRAHSISSHGGFPSDTNLLVDACIARVRETARLDDDAVLPPLPRIAPRRDVVIFKKDRSGSCAAVATPASLSGTRRVLPRTGGARSRWGVAFCAMIASAFGTAAFLASPVGHAPPVRRATSAARAHAGAAARATVALFAR